ncbi:TetR/AcrR family transcriptional regulator [Nocardia puris]|uniref:TetR family transcriptional regulator n=1 Tax=Nocardia puris TaxID=208602 RepID=A0A366DX22_9NOCA|nr:TetR/AcrR family transcriptional regulator [Nocardia puris]MBF6210409.1 TetR/AcrR family transcriptional regulator [Nocardia puris]MBF6367484.1 TetR/AcrR family transcriptional regulator [Nocardia puris]MBF6457669.1 TetR/AcrR family transcriptional regulator [Nocardia puris]RBO93834.1 TetR family transcriptional regulator [Nocardia puris]
MTEPKLHRAAIVDTAIALADTEGLDALSMRRIADRLGVGAMSLYRHLANKDELIAAMTDEITRRHPYPDPAGTGWTWRDRVRIAAEVDWALYREHPWVLLTFAMPRYSFGPYSMDALAWLVEGFRELDVSPREAMQMAFTVWNYISGATLPYVSSSLVTSKGIQPDGHNGLRALLDGTPLNPVPPALAELEGAGVSDLTSEDLLFSGLEALCDGFAARVAARTR